MRLGFLRVSSFCAFPLSFRANWKCQNGPCFWCSSSFFSLSRKREKRQCRLEKSLLARAWSGERDATKTRAKKRHGRVAYLFFRTNSICAKEVFVCSRTKVESRKARARLAKNFVWRLFPLEKKKNILAFAPFFAPCALFFFFFGLVFVSFLAKNGGKFLSHSLGSWFFQVYYNTLLWTPPSLCMGSRYFLRALETRL